MIAYLAGKLVEKHPTYVMLEVGGVGYHIHIPLSSYDALGADNDQVKVLTHLHVREDILALYGFATPAERDLFELLIGVSGIGPPLAQKIMSGVMISEFKRMVSAEDAKGLTRIKGVGQKLAQRLVLELKDKVGALVTEVFQPDGGGTRNQSLLDEATAALVGLGANPMQARKVVSAVMQELGDDAPIEVVIKRALRAIG